MRFELASIKGYAGRMVVTAALLVGACSSDGKSGTDAGGGNAAAGSGGRGGATGDGSGNAGTTGAAGTSGAAGGGGLTGLGGFGGFGGFAGATGTCTQSSCAANEYCDFSNNLCASDFGTCKPRPMDCIVPERKVCGCDGKVYRAECDANGSGQDVSRLGGCTAPAGTFACGPIFCTHGAEYCVATNGGAITNAGTYQCLTLPAGCGATPTCACLSDVSHCGVCTMSASADLTMTCLVP